MQAQLLKYTDKCFSSLTTNLFDTKDNCTIEIIHKLRLNIKRLRTIFKILEYRMDKKIEFKVLEMIDRLFLYSGKLRDIQVQILLLKTFQNEIGEEVDIFISIFKKEKKRIEKEVVRSLQIIDPFDIVLLNQRLDNSIEALSDFSIETILQVKTVELFNQIKAIINSEPNEKSLHRIRIMLKELIYTLSVIKKGKNKFRFNPSIVASLKNLQQKLGEWHDLKVLFNKVESIKVESAKLAQIIEVDRNYLLTGILNDFKKVNEMSWYA